ncbi:MAG: hypothetical protein HWD61_02665 [Parachlamydiaceae bacterium]|nr:MAG: hypothetical protein HWD61_02665 [Parachlamydiaceae bacterium]
MNSSMWRSKALQRSVQTLREDGQQVIEPLERLSFEYASKEMEINHVMPSVESVLSILKLEEEISEV